MKKDRKRRKQPIAKPSIKKSFRRMQRTFTILLTSALCLTGCIVKYDSEIEMGSVYSEMNRTKEESREAYTASESANQELATESLAETQSTGESVFLSESEQYREPEHYTPDWSGYFGDLTGAAVIFEPENNTFWIYNEELADTRRSPCSTFKIISSLAGLKTGVIDRANSMRPWSGEIFWNEDWNRDMDFQSAFRSSCVWYFRQIIDEIGPEPMEEILEELQYGNCDISDWSGSLNTNNSNPALNGFWIESSLKISPKEQTEVLERIFGESSSYSEEIQTALQEVMLLEEASEDDCLIYGKTGMGKAAGIVADCWYAGFADVENRIYFCIYLGETPNQNVSSTRAREIAVSIIKDQYNVTVAK